MAERLRATSWPPRRHVRPAPAPPTPPARAANCPECASTLDYTPPPGVRDIDCVTCGCGYQFIVDLSGALERKASRTFEAIPEERRHP